MAQPYPTKPVKIMVGASAGGGTDIIARSWLKSSATPSRPVSWWENRPGASNTIAADLTAKAPPDGHTLLAATNTGQAIAPAPAETGLRPDPRPDAHRIDRHSAQRACGHACGTGEGRARAHRPDESETRRIQVCFFRHRQHAAHRR